MVELDAEKVMTIPRRIYAREVVDRGFMSNFLFSNISGIFGTPKEVIEMINNMPAIEKPKKLKKVEIDDGTKEELSLNDYGEVEISDEIKIGLAEDIFGDKVYKQIDQYLEEAISEETKDFNIKIDREDDNLGKLREILSSSISDKLIYTAKKHYESDIKKSTEKQLKRDIKKEADNVVNRIYGDYTIEKNKLEKVHDEEIKQAQDSRLSMDKIAIIQEDYEKQCQDGYKAMVESIKNQFKSEKTVQKIAETIVETVESEKKNLQKHTIECDIRNHLRGFSRTIPAFLMAYGDENTTLANFDSLVPEDVFIEVTTNLKTGKGVSLENFRFLRGSGYYYLKDDAGNELVDEEHRRYFEGGLFDEIVFNDAVKEFMKRRYELANYFENSSKVDIFDYIPPQKTNQIFTPKAVVIKMVDYLEEENPGCFDNEEATFADLYMKSGMYVAEIVKRLYQSSRLQSLYPDKVERLNHIFEKQVYGCAPTEIIYRICSNYILGFSDKIRIKKHNIKLCDTLPYAQQGRLEEVLKKIFFE